jgi:Calpain family cysteine protease
MECVPYDHADQQQLTSTEEQARPGGAPTAGGPVAEQILRLQRLAGNGAVANAIAGQQAPPELKGPENNLGIRIPVSPDLAKSAGEPKVYLGEMPENIRNRPRDYAWIDGEAFVKGEGDTNAVDPNDVQQQFLGDCYLMAAMIAIAKVNPGRIQSLITKKQDGTYDVTLHLKQHWWSWEATPQVINVKPTFLVYAGDKYMHTAYAQPGDKGANGPELWAMLIEKAYAQAMGGYEAIDGGQPEDAAAMLTGGSKERHYVKDLSAEQIITMVDGALKAKKAVMSSTREMSKQEEADSEHLGLQTQHAYAVDSIDPGRGTILVINPIRHQEPPMLAVDGLFRMFFEYIDIVAT